VAVSAKDLIQAFTERQLAIEGQLSELAGAIKALQARMAELSQSPASSRAPSSAGEVKATDVAMKEAGHGEVTPEILAVIAAAVTAFLGKKVRIRSAKMLQSHNEVVNPWAQQGRVLIHASHHLRGRG
jgi:methylmalonyl-CoA carboxyltransferase large subunit